MMDEYDEAIEWLVERPGDIEGAWGWPFLNNAGCLFRACTDTGKHGVRDDGKPCGCLTQVKARHFVAFKPSLTSAIRADVRIHKSAIDLERDLRRTKSLAARRRILQPYAEWQRRMDVEIRGKAVKAQ